MQSLRHKILTLVLTMFVGLGLASQSLAHRLPTGAEQALQALQEAGVPVAALCGHAQDKAPCADASCPICPGAAATLEVSPPAPAPVLVALAIAMLLPKGETPVAMRLLQGHYSHGPPPV